MSGPIVVVHRLRVRYSECDMQGVAFNANYVDWMDIAFNELWRERCGPYGDFAASGFDVVVAEVGVRYRSPARFDEDVDVAVTVEKVGETSLITSHRFTRGDTLLAEGTYRHVCVRSPELTKTPWPADARAGLGG